MTCEWNLFDQENNNEQQMFSDLLVEFTDIGGFPIKYYISLAKMDRLFGEDPSNDYAEPVTTKLVYEPTDETSILDSFGFQGNDTIQYAMISKQMFERDIGPTFLTYSPSATIQPMVGDVITTLWNSRNYEIVDLGSEEKIFQGKKHIWEFILRPFRFSNESTKSKEIHLTDNVDDIQIIEDENDGNGVNEYPEVKLGDNEWVENESDTIDNYNDVDKKIFGL